MERMTRALLEQTAFGLDAERRTRHGTGAPRAPERGGLGLFEASVGPLHDIASFLVHAIQGSRSWQSLAQVSAGYRGRVRAEEWEKAAEVLRSVGAVELRGSGSSMEIRSGARRAQSEARDEGSFIENWPTTGKRQAHIFRTAHGYTVQLPVRNWKEEVSARTLPEARKKAEQLVADYPA